jgi:tetratricopeptide (TPR) repeat protein
MVRSAGLLLINISIIFNAVAQSATIDKNKVMDLFQNQQFDEAISYLGPSVAADSGNLPWLGFLGYAYYMNDNAQAAEQCFLKIFGLDSNNVSAIHYLAGMKSDKEPDQARSLTLRLIALQPSRATWYRNMADLLHRVGQADSALMYYDRAYALAPNDYKNAAGLADMLLEKKDYSRADSVLDAGLARDSLNYFYLKLRVRSAYEAKDYQNALLSGEKLVRLEDINVTPLTQLALSYYFLKNFPGCIRVCEYMLGKGLDIEAIYYYEARAWAKLKEYDKSNALLEVCLSKAISQTAESYYYDLGENYESLKKYRLAIAQYDTAYYLFKNPVMKYNGGRIYDSELKNPMFARKYYLQYLATAKPKSADEKRAYEYVRGRWEKKKPATGAK